MHTGRTTFRPAPASGLRRLVGGAGAVALWTALAVTPAAGAAGSDEVVLPGPAFDIAATPSGSVLVGVEGTVHENLALAGLAGERLLVLAHLRSPPDSSSMQLRPSHSPRPT